MRNQLSLRLSTEPDARYCARAFCRVPRRKRATHVVTLAGREFRVCSECARAWESVRSAKVRKIEEAQSA